MKEYVSKDDLRLMKTEECAGHTIEYAMGWKACIDWIKTIPAADVREVVRGEWKTALLDHEGFGIRPKVLYCSECHQAIAYKTNFCPNCGAEMKGEAD